MIKKVFLSDLDIETLEKFGNPHPSNKDDFNYSSNKSYLSSSKIRVKNDNTDTPVSYLTTVGLYDANSNLLATAKLSEPIKKTPDTELVLRVRLDY